VLAPLHDRHAECFQPAWRQDVHRRRGAVVGGAPRKGGVGKQRRFDISALVSGPYNKVLADLNQPIAIPIRSITILDKKASVDGRPWRLMHC